MSITFPGKGFYLIAFYIIVRGFELVKSTLTKFLIRAIEGINHAVSYFEHDIKRGNARKTVAISIILLFVLGITFIGSGVTGQITRARESASTLSDKLGSIESNFQKLALDYDLLNSEKNLCANARDKYLSDLDGCKASLTVKTSQYETAKSDYDSCSLTLITRTNEYNSCSGNLSNTSGSYGTLVSAHATLTSNYNALLTTNNEIIVNTVKDRCCTLTTATSVNYKVTTDNHIQCFVTDAERTGFVSC